MGLFSFTSAGVGFILIGSYESLSSPVPYSPLDRQISNSDTEINMKDQCLIHTGSGVFSLLFIIDASISLFNSDGSKDLIGCPLQLQVIAISALFLLYSILGLVSKFYRSVRFPSSILDLVLLFAFTEEFLLYFLQRKDTSGIENRYFDLLLVPISICVVSTIQKLKSSPNSKDYARMLRGVGLILQGTWFLQMGISFYTNMITHGCFLHERSRGDYTIKCKGHPEYHRARGIATLQFNCHLVLLVVVMVSAFSITMAKKYGDGKDLLRYKPLGAEMQEVDDNGHFTLDSDEDEFEQAETVNKEKLDRVEMGVYGYDSHGELGNSLIISGN